METFLNTHVVKRVELNVAAGTGDNVDSDIVDMADFEEATFIALLGTVTSTGTVIMSLRHGDESGGGDQASVEGSAVAITPGDDDKELAASIVSPQKRYVSARIARGGSQNSEIDSVLCILSRPRVAPVTQPASLVDTVTLIAPASGTP